MPIVLPSTSHPSLTEPTYLRPPVWKQVLAWAGVGVGALTLLGAAASVGDGFASVAALAMFGLALILPGGWWLYCENRDRTHADEDHRLDSQAALAQQTMAGYVAPDALAPLAWHTPLTPVSRRWPVVGSAAFALVVGSMGLMPAAEVSPAPAATPVPATSTVTTTAPARAAVASSTDSPSPSRAPLPASSPQPVAPPPPAPEPVYTPAPAPVQQSTYYANCSAARAAGAAPLMRGEPGYAPKLDRDNDGVACE
ncbi:MAG: excalibur calcium-binding domain-containing protein [Dietzia sp.]|uniref:excalibur calcium-binding domain-containing protein n=2 Tax=unclassified Dietzia TaxID=2617939 RepID=UPI0027230242|nr:excalibur calcium-binding domain-containing protein [Dietzia sp.]MDO8395259.1 excalibur calcium-binding domain-containing protein [Dietzia sp.]